MRHCSSAPAFDFRSNDTLIDHDPADGEPTVVAANDYRFEVFRRTLRTKASKPPTAEPAFQLSAPTKGTTPMSNAMSSPVAFSNVGEGLRLEPGVKMKGADQESRVLRLRDLAYVPYFLLAAPNGLALAALFSSVVYGMCRKSNPADAKLINRHGWRAFFLGLAMQTVGAVIAIYYPELFQK